MDPSSPREPESRAREARGGDPEAVDAWFRAEHPRVYRLCFGLLADAAEAEDLAQDAMLHLHDRLDRWDPERPYERWRDAVVVNLCRDRLRRSVARREAHRRALEFRQESVLPDPLEEIERGEVTEALREGLRVLSPREREAFVLRDLEERSTNEVSEILGVEPSTVRSLTTLARRRLRGLFAARLPGLAFEEGAGA